MLRSLTTLLVILAFVAVNIFSYFFSFRIDFTEGKIYTLSASTKQIVRTLPKDLYIKAFVSENLPPQAVSVRQNLKDYLEEYAKLSKGKLHVEYTDPAKKEEDKQLAQYLGIPELQLNVVEKDQQQVVNAYLGLTVYTKAKVKEEEVQFPLQRFEKYEVLPFVEKFDGFEYDLTSAIKKVSSAETKTVGFLSGHQEHQLKEEQQRQQMFNMQQDQDPRADYPIKKLLEKNYTVTKVLLTEDHPVIENIDTLVVAGPKEALKDFEVEAIKKFVASGKNAIFLIDQIDIGEGLQASKLPESFQALLSSWGVSVDQSLVKDAVHSSASFNQGFITFSVPYPFWVQVQNIVKNNPITSKLESFVAPWVSPLTLTKVEGVTQEILASTSTKYALEASKELVQAPETSAEKTTQKTETPEVAKTEELEKKQEWKDRVMSLSPQQDFGIKNEVKKPLPLAVIAQKKGEGKVFVMGDSDFVTFSNMFESNAVFFLNIVDSFTLGDELISIRAKTVQDQPLGIVGETEKALLRWGNMLFIPVFVILFGLTRRWMRNVRKKLV